MWFRRIGVAVILVVLLTSMITPVMSDDARPPQGVKSGQIWINPTDQKAMVFVPAGEFLMGSREEDADSDKTERPQRSVYLDAYWIDKTEVTVAEYRDFCEATGRKMPEAPSWGWKDKHPIVNVTWEDANAYAKWAGKRLPTEAEWEKAARGTDGRKYPWGNAAPDAGGKWRCNINGAADGDRYTAPVGSFPEGSSPYGCLDMAGNVMEWCADWFDNEYYGRKVNRNPKGPASGSTRVVRGGSWCFFPMFVRCAYRGGSNPMIRDGNFGFRCARDAK